MEPKTFSATAQLLDPIVSIPYTYEWGNHSHCGFRKEAEAEKGPTQAAAYKALCLLQTLSPREYIASRYTKTFDWSPYPDYQP